MLPKIIKKENLKGFVEALMAASEVAGPVPKMNKFAFEGVGSFEEMALDYDTSLISPRKFFYPQYETVLEFKLAGGESRPVVESKQRVLFGVHPCDVAATWLLGVVFSEDPKDPNYLEKREKATIIGMNCQKPCDKFCFCKDMKTYNATEGFDLMLTDLGDRYFVEVGTKRGEAALVENAEFSDASAADMKALQDWQGVKEANFVNRIPYDTKFLPEILGQSDNSLVWEAVGRICFSCGACNTTCPTCYCFNVKDEVGASLAGGARKRIWDSCQLAEFTEVAGGEVFRKERSARLRHRFNRKGKWLLERFGKLGCVGCGRCDRNCLVHINSVEVYTQLAGERVQ